MLLNEYEIEFMFRKIRNIRNLGNVHIRGPHIVMSRTDAQNGLDSTLTISLCIPSNTLCQSGEFIGGLYSTVEEAIRLRP